MTKDAIVAADVGATNLRVALFSSEGKMLKKLIVRTPTTGKKDVVARKIFDMVKTLMGDAGKYKVVGVAVGTIGPLDLRKGEVVNTPNNPIRNFALRTPLKELFNVSDVYVVNDCVAAVWGEHIFGAGIGIGNLVYVTFSSGIGAGVIVDGNLLLGKDGNAHEVGHIVVDYNGIECGCGGKGHWEGYASGSRLPYFAAHLAKKWKRARTEAWSKAIAHSLDMVNLFKYHKLRDEFADSIIKKLIEINAAGLASIVNTYDPELIVIGGSIALNNPDFIEKVKKRINRYIVNRPPEIIFTSFRENAVLYGAAAIVIEPPKSLINYY
jgi:glucokinase